MLRRKVFDQYPMSGYLFSRLDESGNSGCLTAASLMESVRCVNAGKLKCLSSYKPLNQQEFAKILHCVPDLVCRTRNGKLLET